MRWSCADKRGKEGRGKEEEEDDNKESEQDMKSFGDAACPVRTGGVGASRTMAVKGGSASTCFCGVGTCQSASVHVHVRYSKVPTPLSALDLTTPLTAAATRRYGRGKARQGASAGISSAVSSRGDSFYPVVFSVMSVRGGAISRIR